jgi:hypothetical protein
MKTFLTSALSALGLCFALVHCNDPPVGKPADASIVDADVVEERTLIDVAPPTTRIIDLSSQQQILLCDWTAQELGGYGSQGIPCPDNAVSDGIGAPASLQDCVSVYQISRWGTDCPLTVLDFMNCWQWQIDHVCNVSDLSLLPPECKTQLGPLCEGAIYSDARAPAPADAADAGTDAGDAGDASPDTPTGSDAAIEDASIGDSAAPLDAADGSLD